MKILQIRTLSKRYSRKDAYAVRKFSMEVEQGELLALIGESGSGKTTLLRLIAGFEQPEEGEICINGHCVVNEKTYVVPEKRNVGMVFQDYALFPHLTIADNIGFGIRKLPGKKKTERVTEVLKLVGLNGYESRYPHQLSGGQQQRIALARALAPKPSLILLDEPFSNLDGVLKEQVREDIRRIIKATDTTAIFVTHDTKDALSTADRIAILKEGKIQQLGTPEEVYNFPKSIYVANFFGKVNVINAIATDGGYTTQIGFVPCPVGGTVSGKVTLAIRPENIQLCSAQTSPLSGILSSVAYLGDQKQLIIAVEREKTRYKLLVRVPNDIVLKVDDQVHFQIKQEKIQVLDTCWYPAATQHL